MSIEHFIMLLASLAFWAFVLVGPWIALYFGIKALMTHHHREKNRYRGHGKPRRRRRRR